MATRAQAQPSPTAGRTSWLAIRRAGQARVSWLIEAILVVVLLAVTWQTLALARNHEATLTSQRALIDQQAATQAQLEQVKAALAPTAFTVSYDEETGQGVRVTVAEPTSIVASDE
jgi:hypothetical protein